MNTQDITKSTEQSMDKTINAFAQHLNQIRTGRANASMLSTVMVNSYGTLVPINQVASIGAPEAQLIVVKPYDKSQIGNIVSGINKADLGFNPIPDAEIIRINVPPLTEEIRKNVIKKMYKELEEFKIQIRNERRKSIDSANSIDKSSDDAIAAFDKDIQVVTDKYIKKLDEMAKQKEKELLTI